MSNVPSDGFATAKSILNKTDVWPSMIMPDESVEQTLKCLRTLVKYTLENPDISSQDRQDAATLQQAHEIIVNSLRESIRLMEEWLSQQVAMIPCSGTLPTK